MKPGLGFTIAAICVAAAACAQDGGGVGAASSVTLGGQQPTSGKWTEPVVVITPTSLSAVQVGMSVPESEAAAGKPFDGSGDGAHYPIGNPELYVVPGAPCVGVSGVSTGVTAVVTADGVRTGDSADRITAVYGGRAQYVPAPNFGRTPAAGYTVSFPDGELAFVVLDGGIRECTLDRT